MPLSTTSLSGSSLPLEKYYPVLTLPTEITSGIFTHFLPLYPSFPPLTGMESPNLLTHICHDWREIALNTPRLWRTIPIFGRHAERGHLELIRLWLQRSQPMPLSLRIWSPYWPLADSAITAIIPHRHRYAYLYLRFPQASAVAAIDGPMPLLQHLDLHVVYESSGDNVVFHGAPLLRSVVVRFFRAALTLPWAQLTSLKAIQWMRPTDPEPILMSCPNLLHLDLSEVGNYWHPRDNITLARLESLKIHVAILGAAPLGSPPLILPALRHLAVVAGEIGRETDGLTDFVRNARCSRLAQLSITGPASAQSLEDAYRTAFPSVSVTFNWV